MSNTLRIGELASAAGVSTDAVRYYERLRILPRPARTQAGYRLYSSEDLERLRFIKQAKSLGLSLDEIRGLLPGRGAGLSECRRVRDILALKVAELDAKILELRAFRKVLGAYLDECEEALAGKRGDCCPVLFEIARPASDKKASGASSRRREPARGVNR
jgi:DNA-binding transcriptional MerR regulator